MRRLGGDGLLVLAQRSGLRSSPPLPVSRGPLSSTVRPTRPALSSGWPWVSTWPLAVPGGLALAWGISVHPALPLWELSAITPWCVLLNGKWSSLETTQKAETGVHAAPQSPLWGPHLAPGPWLDRRAPWEVAVVVGGRDTGPRTRIPSFLLRARFGCQGGGTGDLVAHELPGRKMEISAAPQGALGSQAVLRPGSRNRFLLFFKLCFPHSDPLW